jgi:very-short-patch-repair endonuclease
MLAIDGSRVRADLVRLLRFADHLLALGDRSAAARDGEALWLPEGSLYATDGMPLPGIDLAPADDVFLSVARQRERPPPELDPSLQPWLRLDTHPAPSRPPSLLLERTLLADAETTTDIIEAGLASGRVHPAAAAPGRDAPAWDVPVRPASLPAVVAALAAYLAGPWRDWAAAEAPRRQAMRLYEALYTAHAEIAAAGGNSGPELVIGIGLACFRRGGPVLPLFEQRAEFDFDAVTGTLSILPRDLPAELAIDATTAEESAGFAPLRAVLEAAVPAIGEPFDPGAVRALLADCAARPDPGCTVVASQEALADGEGVRIWPGFCLLVRPRPARLLREDIARMARALSGEAALLAEAARRFVLPPPAFARAESGDAAGVAERASLFLALPANDEQVAIVRRLERPDVHGLVVQGPPGTGKTHTIANIIGHWMATGRRVLVTAHTARALDAIRDKLPPALRALVIAATHGERDSRRQIEDAVLALVEQVQALDPAEADRQMAELQERLARTDAALTEIDAALAAIAAANLTQVAWRGGSALPHLIAAWVAGQAGRHDWFPDRLDLTPEFEPRFGDAAIAEAAALRRKLGADLTCQGVDLPALARLAEDRAGLEAAHRRLLAAARQQARLETLARVDPATADAAALAAAQAWLERLEAWLHAGGGAHGWMARAWEHLLRGTPVWRDMLQQAAALRLDAEPLRLAEPADPLPLGRALANLAAGRRPFGLLGGLRGLLLGNPVRPLLADARIAGSAPRRAADWALLADLHAWRQDAGAFAATWNLFAVRHQVTGLPVDRDTAREASLLLGGLAGGLLALATEAEAVEQTLLAVLSRAAEAQAAVQRLQPAPALAALRAHRDRVQQAAAEGLRDALLTAADSAAGPLREALRRLAEGLGEDGTDIAPLAEAACAQIARLGACAAEFRRLAELAEAIRASGAPHWARLIASQAAGAEDALLPADWRDAWDYARARGFLARIADPATVRHLTREAEALGERRRALLLEAIGLRIHAGLRARLTEATLADLAKFVAARARLAQDGGAATATRLRRVMRDSLRRAIAALPCWIIPEWRVGEHLPAEPGSFDLVIIDEASQSGITALPAVLRGRKLLVIGDDQQVSPSAVGIAGEAVDRLRAIWLAGQTLAEQIDPATSLYELAAMMYPAGVVMLREHFRCVPAIIGFSARFYAGRLLPLRLATPGERLGPPLVDVFVADGRRRGAVNEAEAEAVVAEIAAIVGEHAPGAPPRRSIGVIALHGDRQARLIQDRLIETIGPEAMSDHRILCGNAASFQGQERDIVFLSMVHDAASAVRQTGRAYLQRYNVALSRARDRLVLVRSVSAAALKEGDIKLDVLRHFQPPAPAADPPGDVLAACRTEFERTVGARLVAAGYRIRPQVAIGGGAIDFVVEGAGDRRLAVALDGDVWQAPDRWAEEVRRQKALERFGWRFWRCWGSAWEAQPAAMLADLLAALEGAGVAPAAAPAGAPPADHAALVYRGGVRVAPGYRPPQSLIPQANVAHVVIRWTRGWSR